MIKFESRLIDLDYDKIRVGFLFDYINNMNLAKIKKDLEKHINDFDANIDQEFEYNQPNNKIFAIINFPLDDCDSISSIEIALTRIKYFLQSFILEGYEHINNHKTDS